MSKGAGFDEVMEQCARARSRALKLRQEGHGLVQRLRDNIQELAGTASETREIVRSLKRERDTHAEGACAQTTVPEPGTTPAADITAFLSSMSENELDALADRLIDAYHEAEMRKDTVAHSLIEAALYQLGYALAARVGPRASGLVLN